MNERITLNRVPRDQTKQNMSSFQFPCVTWLQLSGHGGMLHGNILYICMSFVLCSHDAFNSMQRAASPLSRWPWMPPFKTRADSGGLGQHFTPQSCLPLLFLPTRSWLAPPLMIPMPLTWCCTPRTRLRSVSGGSPSHIPLTSFAKCSPCPSRQRTKICPSSRSRKTKKR